MRKSFVFYRSFYDGIKEMPKATQGEIYASIMEYIFTGNVGEMNDPISRALFALIKPQLDANTTKYENGKKGAPFGKLGGRPKKETPQESLNAKDEAKEIPSNDNLNVNSNVNMEKYEATIFTPPTVSELTDFLKTLGESNATQMANNFFNFYHSKGWMVGQVKMNDWQGSARLWQKRNYSNFKKTDYKHPASNYQNSKPINPNF